MATKEKHCSGCCSNLKSVKFAAGVKEEAQTPYTRGPKDSAGKTAWRVFPFAEAEHVVRVFAKGVEKYGAPFTYRRGIPLEELAEAAIRHATAILSGKLLDPETGELHAAHLAANGLIDDDISKHL